MRKILYIEDEHNLQKVFRDFLEKKHCHLYVFHTQRVPKLP